MERGDTTATPSIGPSYQCMDRSNYVKGQTSSLDRFITGISICYLQYLVDLLFSKFIT